MPHAHESKKLHPAPPSLRRAVDEAEREYPDSVRRRDIRRNVKLTMREIRVRIADIVSTAKPGQQGEDDAVVQARTLLTRTLARMQRFGVEAAGLPGFRHDALIDDLAFFIEGELEFVRLFIRDTAREAKMPLQNRADLYGGSAEAMFWRAWTNVMPSGARIWWRLGVAEHCSDCLLLSSRSPFSLPGTEPNPLPTTPRSGATRCLTNCRCQLSSPAVPAGLIPDVGVEITKMGSLDVDPTSPAALAAATQYLDLAERYAWYMRLHVLDPAGGYGRAAEIIKRGMDDIARTNRQTYRLTLTDRELQAPARAALNAGLRYRASTSLDDDLVLAVATVIAMNYADRGKITAIFDDPPRVELDDERVYQLDDEGRSILLTE